MVKVERNVIITKQIYKYYSYNRPMNGIWVQNNINIPFKIDETRRFIITQSKLSNEIIKKLELKSITKVTDKYGNIDINLFYSSYNINRNLLYKKGLSDREIKGMIANEGIVNTANEIKIFLKE